MQKIKRELIHKAKVKKQYAKIKAAVETTQQRSHDPSTAQSIINRSSPANERYQAEDLEGNKLVENARESLISQDEQFNAHQDTSDAARNRQSHQSKQRRPRTNPYGKEVAAAEQRQAEVDARRAAREKADRDRAEKLAERERFRKAMAKARSGGKNGQRKLGRESQVLLERVQRIMGS